MAQLLLDEVDRGAFLDQLGSMRVAKSVGVDTLVDADLGRQATEQVAHVGAGQKAPARVQKSEPLRIPKLS